MSLDSFETEIIRLGDDKLIDFLRYNNIIVSGLFCDSCGRALLLKNYKKIKDGISWQCINSHCDKYRKMISIRKNSFFENFNLSILTIIKIFIRWACDQPQYSIIQNLEINTRTYKKIILKFMEVVDSYDSNDDKLGGPGKIVQVDETSLNFKVKSHRGRSPINKTDALCIVEFDTRISRAFACVISDKKASTILPIINQNVELGSIIHTDEHKSYFRLNYLGYVHDTVCHKYEFVNRETGTNTQAVESFNNELNLDIKRRKGVATMKRPEFLKEFVWKFNNREKRFLKIWELLKIKN